MASSWLLKYQTILDYFPHPTHVDGRRQLIDDESANAIDMNNPSRQ